MSASTTREPDGRDVVWFDELPLITCWSSLESAKVGRVGFVRGGRPIILPVNHVVDGESIVFRTDPTSALGALAVGEPVAFEVDGMAPDHQTGWSVLVRGEVERVDDRARRRMGERGPEPWAPGDRDEWLRIVPSSVTGRAISRRQQLPDGTYLPYMRPD
jgi:nitroimidazol reductase NimA-like FMN-containing flavoprotein (pyridoxamine 5'-phosphate oxidase superfamily)